MFKQKTHCWFESESITGHLVIFFGGTYLQMEVQLSVRTSTVAPVEGSLEDQFPLSLMYVSWILTIPLQISNGSPCFQVENRQGFDKIHSMFLGRGALLTVSRSVPWPLVSGWRPGHWKKRRTSGFVWCPRRYRSAREAILGLSFAKSGIGRNYFWRRPGVSF